jgi:hypothetical protein
LEEILKTLQTLTHQTQTQTQNRPGAPHHQIDPARKCFNCGGNHLYKHCPRPKTRIKAINMEEDPGSDDPETYGLDDEETENCECPDQE